MVLIMIQKQHNIFHNNLRCNDRKQFQQKQENKSKQSQIGKLGIPLAYFIRKTSR